MKALDPPHWTQNSWFGAFHTIWVHLGPFRRLTKLGSKQSKLVQLIQKFMPRSHFGIFGDEHTRSTPLYPKLMVWRISYCLGAFGTVSSPYETLLKTGRTGAINTKVRATKSRQNFSQRLHLIHPIGPLNSCFGAFCTAWVHFGQVHRVTKLGSKRAELVQLIHVRAMKSYRNFPQ